MEQTWFSGDVIWQEVTQKVSVIDGLRLPFVSNGAREGGDGERKGEEKEERDGGRKNKQGIDIEDRLKKMQPV